MGLNWSEGLKEAGRGMDSLGAAMAKTDELEYRNIRDKNLRRFKLEDQEREDRLLGEKHKYEEGKQVDKDLREDETLGIVPESDRGADIIAKEEEDRAKKQADELEKIRARLSKSASGKELSKAAYIDRGMQEMKVLWDASIDIRSNKKGNRMMPAHEKDMYRNTFAADWEAMQNAAGVPFAPAEEEQEESKVVNWGDMPDG